MTWPEQETARLALPLILGSCRSHLLWSIVPISDASNTVPSNFEYELRKMITGFHNS